METLRPHSAEQRKRLLPAGPVVRAKWPPKLCFRGLILVALMLYVRVCLSYMFLGVIYSRFSNSQNTYNNANGRVI